MPPCRRWNTTFAGAPASHIHSTVTELLSSPFLTRPLNSSLNQRGAVGSLAFTTKGDLQFVEIIEKLGLFFFWNALFDGVT